MRKSLEAIAVQHRQMKLCRNKSWEDAVPDVFYGRERNILGAYDTPIIGNVKLISPLTITFGICASSMAG